MSEALNIGMLCPPGEVIPVKSYGGSEFSADKLTRNLNTLGNHVTAVACRGSSMPEGIELEEVGPGPLLQIAQGETEEEFSDDLRRLSLEFLDEALEYLSKRDDLDIIHSHFAPELAVYERAKALGIEIPIVTTFHGGLAGIPDDVAKLAQMRIPAVSISRAQSDSAPGLEFMGPIYHDVEEPDYPVNRNPRDCAAWVGRIQPIKLNGEDTDEKGLKDGIEWAGKTGLDLAIACKIDPRSQSQKDYFDHIIRPLLKEYPHCEFLGELSREDRDTLLGDSLVYIGHLNYLEAFGYTMAEASIAGVPAIVRNRGAAPEVVEHDLTGFVCETNEEMVDALDKIGSISRLACRAHAKAKFSAETNVNEYLSAYHHVLGSAAVGRHRQN